MKHELIQMKKELTEELRKNLFYWEKMSWDSDRRIFRTLGCDNKPLISGYRSSVLISRILWAFSSAYRMTGEEAYLQMARNAYLDLCRNYLDSMNGGLYEGLYSDGIPASYKKKIYTQSFAVYGLTEYYLASGEEESLKLAEDIYQRIETHARIDEKGTYSASLNSAWQDQGDVLMLDTCLHLIEAYTNLLCASRNKAVEQSLHSIIDSMSDHFLREDGALYQKLNRDWTPTEDCSDRYGDDAEACWMLLAAAEQMENPAYAEKARAMAGRLLNNLVKNGYDDEFGGVFDRKQSDGSMKTDKLWWEESESVIALLSGYSLTHDEETARKALRTWQFIREHICMEDGSWTWQVTKDGTAVPVQNPGDPLMCPYHSVRLVTHASARIQEICGEKY